MSVSASMKVALDDDPQKKAYFEKCERLQVQLQASLVSSGSLGLKKRSSNLFRHRKGASAKIDVRDFNRVISIDSTRLLAEIEGMTPYDAIVDATLKHHLLPAVVPELKSITIGGALSGIGIESSSFRYGLVHETIEEFDVLLSSGEIITCRADNEHRELFFAFPNSYGTFGYALRVVVKLVPAKRYVRLAHQHFYNAEAMFDRLKEVCTQNRDNGIYDFVEAAAFDVHDMVITTGRMVNQVPYLHDYTHMRIYYRSLLNRTTDYLTAKDYIWRWDTDWFWCSKVFGMQNTVMRALLGKWCLNSRFYWRLMRLAHRKKSIKYVIDRMTPKSESVIQDVAIPIDNALAFFNFFNEEIGIKPFWMCPVMNYDAQAQYTFFDVNPDTLYINFGFWATVPSTREEGYYNRLIEQKVVELGGIKSLYSNAFYSEAEFWKIYDKTHYQQLKAQYDSADRFGNLYQKCTERT